MALLAGCGPPGPPLGAVGHVSGFLGYAVSDEPRATLAGRDILSAGGSAADAAVAMYFTLAVTMPVSAGLGGGGACVTHETKGKKAEALDFMLRPAAAVAPGAAPAGVPANVRGMAALHARYGQMRWEQLVFPAERMARFGHPASRALVMSLGDALGRAPLGSELRALFTRADGAALAEGDDIRQLDLAGVLGQIRANGAGELYTGSVARRLSEGAGAAGVGLTYEDFGVVRPAWSAPVQGAFGSHKVSFPVTPGGHLAAALWRALGDDRRYGRGSAADRAYGMYQASLAAPDGVLSYDPGVVAFGAVDSGGNAVACAVTLNGAFGTGRVIRGTGIVAARAPALGADPAIAVAPVIVSNVNNGNLFFLGAPSGSAAPVAMATVLARALGDGRTLDEAMGEPRIAVVAPGAAAVETGAPAEVASRLTGTGARTTPVPAVGAVGAIYCPDGLLRDQRACVARADPRGYGFAAGGMQ